MALGRLSGCLFKTSSLTELCATTIRSLSGAVVEASAHNDKTSSTAADAVGAEPQQSANEPDLVANKEKGKMMKRLNMKMMVLMSRK